MFKKFTISLPADLYLLIEENRENTPRSTYIQMLCKKSLLEKQLIEKILEKEKGVY